MNTKRLELDFWMTSRFRDDTVKYDHYTEIAPIIGKPGRYLRGKMSGSSARTVAPGSVSRAS